MKSIIHILQYIIKNNPWYHIPFRLIFALFYQLQKRTYAGISSKRLFNGQSILLFPNNPVCSGFVYAPYIDKMEIDRLRELANKHTIFLDIGANIGGYSVLMVDIVKSVIAFEPHPITANYCKMNFLLNQTDIRQVAEKAVGSRCEERYFSNESAASPINSLVDDQNNAIAVKTTTLDSFFEKFPMHPHDHLIIKIDVEGFEHEVLQGGQQFLANAPIKGILFEGFSSQHHDIAQLLISLGFKLEAISKHNFLASRNLLGDEVCAHKHLIHSM